MNQRSVLLRTKVLVAVATAAFSTTGIAASTIVPSAAHPNSHTGEVVTDGKTIVAPVTALLQVTGQPRVSLGYPRAIWDLEDIRQYKQLLNTSLELKSALNELQAWADKRIREPLDVPAHMLEADGTWSYRGFTRGTQDDKGNWTFKWDFNGALQNRTADVSNLGIVYALTGKRAYADYARKLLLAMSDTFGYGKGSAKPDPNGLNHFEYYGFDGGDTGMFLSKACSGYDLIHDLSKFTAGERVHIERDLIRPLAEHLSSAKYMYNGHDRWKMVCLYGIFISGVTLDDQKLVDGALYGLGGSKANTTGGFMDCFNPKYLNADRLWGADAKAEDGAASLTVMIAVAEVMWHRGVDLYGYQNMALKNPFDAGLQLMLGADSKPVDPEYAKLIGTQSTGSYEYAYRRYRDDRYLTLIQKLKAKLVMAESQLPSLSDLPQTTVNEASRSRV